MFANIKNDDQLAALASKFGLSIDETREYISNDQAVVQEVAAEEFSGEKREMPEVALSDREVSVQAEEPRDLEALAAQYSSSSSDEVEQDGMEFTLVEENADRSTEVRNNLQFLTVQVARALFENPDDKTIQADLSFVENKISQNQFGVLVNGFAATTQDSVKTQKMVTKYSTFFDTPKLNELKSKLEKIIQGGFRFDESLNLVSTGKINKIGTALTRAKVLTARNEKIKQALINTVLGNLPLYHVLRDAPLTTVEQAVKTMAKQVITSLNNDEKVKNITITVREREFMNS